MHSMLPWQWIVGAQGSGAAGSEGPEKASELSKHSSWQRKAATQGCGAAGKKEGQQSTLREQMEIRCLALRWLETRGAVAEQMLFGKGQHSRKQVQLELRWLVLRRLEMEGIVAEQMLLDKGQQHNKSKWS
eukprot:1160002-Pelagomonas_calceolata.AAC.20